MASSDADNLIAKADKLTKLTLTRWSADWMSATAFYEQAANSYRISKKYEKAKEAFEKASKGQEMLSSPWDAAKHMESAAALAKELRNWTEVADLYQRAAELYIECGRAQPASDALAKAASALEDAMPDKAIKLYTDACAILEEEGKEQMTFDLYRGATSVYLKLEKFTDAAACLLTLALAADKGDATHSQCKAYLSAIVVYMYAHDFVQAEKCHNDCCQIEAFVSSDQNRCANKLLSAYREGDVEEIKLVAKSSIISNLDNMIIKLARKLPTGDVENMKTDGTKEEEQFDEDDLT
ncbi:membrane traffic protein [Lithospermum erythrorhizon]|uniref:Gamma-soluble NSF attachment protein n=1 Tax=Lithospermum erythrorhizon TaxID=34254 RepID=A0AAV3Q010_LITER